MKNKSGFFISLVKSYKLFSVFLCLLSFSPLLMGMTPKRARPPQEFLSEFMISKVKKARKVAKQETEKLQAFSMAAVKFKSSSVSRSVFNIEALYRNTKIGEIEFVNGDGYNDSDDDSDDYSDDEYACSEPHSKEGRIEMLFVEKPYRGKQVGKRLLAKACTRLKIEGCEYATLVAAPEDKSVLPKLLAFYKRAGFVITGVLPESNDPHPTVSMHKEL